MRNGEAQVLPRLPICSMDPTESLGRQGTSVARVRPLMRKEVLALEFLKA